MLRHTENIGAHSAAKDDAPCRLSLTVAAGCSAVGATGLLINHVSPQSTHLDSLIFVGGYYWALAAANYVTLSLGAKKFNGRQQLETTGR